MSLVRMEKAKFYTLVISNMRIFLVSTTILSGCGKGKVFGIE